MDKLKDLIEQAERILITSHLGTDADSLCSSLLLGAILVKNYPDKEIHVCLEDEASNLNFVNGYDKAGFNPLDESLMAHKPQLLVILDANSIGRATRKPGIVKKHIASLGTKLAIIDHHEQTDKDPSDVYINQGSPAVTQDIYQIFFSQLKLAKPTGYAQTAMLGIYSDTGGFVYENPRYEDTFKIVTQLIKDGASLERIVDQLNQVSEKALQTLAELIKNLGSVGGCTYSFLNDEFVDKLGGKEAVADVRKGVDLFRDNFLRSTNGRTWGFLVHKDLLADEGTYAISLRAMSGTIDVAEMANRLGGGGHKPAAGARIKAANVGEALKTVLDIVK